MTSALPPSIWWERPPSFGTSGAAPPAAGAATGRPAAVCAGAGGRALLAGHRAPRASASGDSGHLRHRREAGRRAGRQAEGD